MLNTFKFKNAIPLNGGMVNEVNYDPDEITVDLFEEACKIASVATLTRETNDKLHLHLFWAAVMAVDDSIVDFTAVNNIKGMKDISNAIDIGRCFFTESEDSDKNEGSDQQSETTVEISTLESENYEEDL